MAQVKVWNDNVYDYQENFRDQNIKIKARSFIMMDEGDAMLFKGSFVPIKTDADGNPTPEGYKKIRIEPLKAESVEATVTVDTLLCQACKYKASNDADLEEHIKDSHKDVALRDEEAEAEIARKKKARAS